MAGENENAVAAQDATTVTNVSAGALPASAKVQTLEDAQRGHSLLDRLETRLAEIEHSAVEELKQIAADIRSLF